MSRCCSPKGIQIRAAVLRHERGARRAGRLLGDRLGFFRGLAEQGQVSAADFVGRQEVYPEMVAEWLRVLTCAGCRLRPEDDVYALPPEQGMIRANDAGPMCFAGGLCTPTKLFYNLPIGLAYRDARGGAQA